MGQFCLGTKMQLDNGRQPNGADVRWVWSILYTSLIKLCINFAAGFVGKSILWWGWEGGRGGGEGSEILR